MWSQVLADHDKRPIDFRLLVSIEWCEVDRIGVRLASFAPPLKGTPEWFHRG
jgi:hypothetical protein